MALSVYRSNSPMLTIQGFILHKTERAITTYRNGREAWYKDRKPDWTQMTNQLRNWYYYNWLSGDFIVEQAVHSLDMMSWAMGDIIPERGTGSGGRQVRTDKKYGNIFDHFAIEFELVNPMNK